VATYVARRDGLPEPIPITRVFPEAPDTDESDWQELVIRHLGLQDWVRVRLTDELDVLGPLATARLREYGVVWPPTLHVDIPLLDTLPEGGSLLDGEGGDEVFGIEAHRIAAITPVLRGQQRPTRRNLRALLGAVAPGVVRAQRSRLRWDARFAKWTPWLRPAVRERLLKERAQADREQPLTFSASVRKVPTRRTQVLTAQNRRFFGRQRGIEHTSPLLDPDVVHALARDGGILGRGDRTVVLRRLVPDLLPDVVLARTSKVAFQTAYMGRHTWTFAKNWNGDGLDPALVDVDLLRASWLNEEPNALTFALAQAAWVATLGGHPPARKGA
jgi:asparagine synthase (glutamine-hydrolysing)